MENKNSVKNVINELQMFQLTVERCDACGESHPILIKTLVNKFEVNETTEVSFYKFVKIGEMENGDPIEEPILLENKEKDCLEFSKPRVFNIEEGTKKSFNMWSYCQNVKEPIFLAFQISVVKND